MEKVAIKKALKLVTFNSPRVFGWTLADVFNKKLKGVHQRYFDRGEPVHHIPPPGLGYRHCGTAVGEGFAIGTAIFGVAGIAVMASWVCLVAAVVFQWCYQCFKLVSTAGKY
eukprot:2152-Heterococcus_DN1.PRE.3